jgi:hypothetical protein
MKRLLAIVATLAAVVLAAVQLLPTASTADSRVRKDHPLVGTWVVTVQLDAPPGQPAPPPFESTIAYTAGGSVVEATSRAGFVAGGLGVWKKTGPSTYSATFRKYRFDAGGAFAGVAVITETIKVTSRGSYTTRASTTDIYSPTGALVAHLDNPPVSAKRMRVG